MLNLLPHPRALKLTGGFYSLPSRAALHLDESLPRQSVMLPIAERLQSVASEIGVELELITGSPKHPHLAMRAWESPAAPAHDEGYNLEISRKGIAIHYRQCGGLRAAVATLRQLLREHGRKLPCLIASDYPDFPHRGVMLDISRGRVPNLNTLLQLVEHLADFKINELQLYTEHTFAYRNYEPVWKDWGAITGQEIMVLSARCRQLGIELVPNQNSFGHLRYWLEYPPLKKLAEVKKPYEGVGGAFLRYPTTLAPTNPGTVSFLRELYDELLPYFENKKFNVGCDETWDLGRGQSKSVCEKLGKGQVYVDFLKEIYREVSDRGFQMMFWGDIILHHANLLKQIPRGGIALNWGYEAGHPFAQETAMFASCGIPFYVCPGTSTWMTLIGRHDNALANLEEAANAGRKAGARGFLNTDWGDGGHPQPLAVSYLPYLAGAALSWCAASYNQKYLIPVLSRDIFGDPTQRTARAALALGLAHKKFKYEAPNVTPFGTVLTAPPPRLRELVCRDGLKYYARIPKANIERAFEEVQKQRSLLYRGTPQTASGEMLALELDMAARMAAESCQIMLWQQALAAGKSASKTLAEKGVRRLHELEQDFENYWPLRNKGSTAKCSGFFRWRMDDYRRGKLHFLPRVAAAQPPVTPA